MNAPIHLVEVGTRLRGTSPETVAALAASIKDVGLLNPITVYECKVIYAHIAVDGFAVVAGAHRLEACRSLGWTEVPIHVVTLSDLERQIAECDENLCGSKLSPSERAWFTTRRKHAYEALHPETRHGAAPGKSGGGKVAKEADVASFAADTAARTGRSVRSVATEAARGAKVNDAILTEIKGTALDTGKALDELAATPREKQAEKVTELRQRVEDRKLVQKAGDEIVQRDASDDAAEMLIEFIPGERMPEMLSYLDASGAGRVTKAIRRAQKVAA